MLSQALVAAFAALAPLVSSSSVLPTKFHVGRSAQYVDDLVSEDAILDALIAANHPAAVPNRTWENYKGETYQTLWEFDEADWQEMRTSLMGEAGVSETDIVTRSALATRQKDDPPPFFCTHRNTAPHAYTAALSAAASGVCQSFVWGAEYVGKRQVVQRHMPDIQNRPIRVTFTYIGKGLQWMVASGCATAMAIGINEACMSIEEGFEGEQPATTGFTAEDSEVEASVTLTELEPSTGSK